MEKEKKIELNLVVSLCCKKGQNLDKTIKLREYIPIKEKLEAIDNYIKSLEFYEKGMWYIDSFEQYFKFTMLAVGLYTNIRIDGTYEEYDSLVKYGLLNNIFAYVQADYDDFKNIMQMKLNDYIRKQSYENKIE